MTDDYVTNGAWLAKPARPDTIDEIADEFERPSGATTFWSDIGVRRAERDMRLAPRTIERRAG
jgi:hypothetical protein